MDDCTSTEEQRDFGECHQQPDLEQIVGSHSVPVFLESDTLAEVVTTTNDFSEIGLTVPSGEILLEQDPMLSIGKCSTCDSELQLVVSEELQRYNAVEHSGSGLKAGAGGDEADVESALRHSVMLRDDGMPFDLENGLNSSPVRRETVGLESGRSIVREKSDKAICHGDKVCRVCHLGFDVQLGNGSAIELGCSCKDDLAAAHLHCAEAWFKIKGNRICEICGSTVQNVMGAGDASFMERWNDRDASTAIMSDDHNFCNNRHLFNFLLACMVFAFVLPWLFHITAIFS